MVNTGGKGSIPPCPDSGTTLKGHPCSTAPGGRGQALGSLRPQPSSRLCSSCCTAQGRDPRRSLSPPRPPTAPRLSLPFTAELLGGTTSAHCLHVYKSTATASAPWFSNFSLNQSHGEGLSARRLQGGTSRASEGVGLSCGRQSVPLTCRPVGEAPTAAVPQFCQEEVHTS